MPAELRDVTVFAGRYILAIGEYFSLTAFSLSVENRFNKNLIGGSRRNIRVPGDAPGTG
jgi:hypothetical protein